MRRAQQGFVRVDGTPLEVITHAEFNRRLMARPDELMPAIGIRIMRVNATTMEIGVQPGVARHADRARGIGVRISGCPMARYDLVQHAGRWKCGDRSQRMAEIPVCKALKQKLDAELASLPRCEAGDSCIDYHCHRVHKDQVQPAVAIESEMVEAECEMPADDCVMAHERSKRR